MSELREKILEYRAKHDMSQRDFANLCHLNVMTINGIEVGKRMPTKMTAKKIEIAMEEKEE